MLQLLEKEEKEQVSCVEVHSVSGQEMRVFLFVCLID